MKQAHYHYAARDAKGRAVRGAIEAASRLEAIAHLRSRALYVTELAHAATARGALARAAMLVSRRASTRTAFFRSFATLVAAGIPVKRALDVLARDGRDAQFSEVVASIAADVGGGASLSAAMERHPDEFSTISIATVKAGEVGGSLDRALRTVAEAEERAASLRKRVAAAMAYPAVVTCTALGLVTFLVAETIPAFASMFAQMHVALPLGTRVLVALGRALHRPWLWLAACAAAALAARALYALPRSDSPWAVAVDAAVARVPVVGTLVARLNGARFSRTLGSLLSAGVDLVSALDAAAGVVSSARYRRALAPLAEALHAGEPLGARFEASGVFDATFLALVRAGEESGALDAMLLRVAAAYELDVEAGFAALTAVVEPLLICLLGGVVAAIVASIILPLYTLIGELK